MRTSCVAVDARVMFDVDEHTLPYGLHGFMLGIVHGSTPLGTETTSSGGTPGATYTLGRVTNRETRRVETPSSPMTTNERV